MSEDDLQKEVLALKRRKALLLKRRSFVRTPWRTTAPIRFKRNSIVPATSVNAWPKPVTALARVRWAQPKT